MRGLDAKFTHAFQREIAREPLHRRIVRKPAGEFGRATGCRGDVAPPQCRIGERDPDAAIIRREAGGDAYFFVGAPRPAARGGDGAQCGAQIAQRRCALRQRQQARPGVGIHIGVLARVGGEYLRIEPVAVGFGARAARRFATRSAGRGERVDCGERGGEILRFDFGEKTSDARVALERAGINDVLIGAARFVGALQREQCVGLGQPHIGRNRAVRAQGCDRVDGLLPAFTLAQRNCTVTQQGAQR